MVIDTRFWFYIAILTVVHGTAASGVLVLSTKSTKKKSKPVCIKPHQAQQKNKKKRESQAALNYAAKPRTQPLELLKKDRQRVIKRDSNKVYFNLQKSKNQNQVQHQKSQHKRYNHHHSHSYNHYHYDYNYAYHNGWGLGLGVWGSPFWNGYIPWYIGFGYAPFWYLDGDFAQPNYGFYDYGYGYRPIYPSTPALAAMLG
ncbi:MAG TPA: hypothetical protein VHA52_02920, partial [Candidatus Babeliaceae bacterium]|nr:hypothetical protein [Candidatus Babeliaceae bacterium]